MEWKTVTISNAFEMSAEELKNSESTFIRHDPQLSRDMKKFWNRHRLWERHLKKKRIGENNEMDN